MSYYLGQIDPVPPPMRPMSWPTIFGWAALVAVTVAIFNGTVNMGGRRVRTNRRCTSRRPRRAAKRLRPNDLYKDWDAVNFAQRQAEKSGDQRAITAAKAETRRVYQAMQEERAGRVRRNATPGTGRRSSRGYIPKWMLRGSREMNVEFTPDELRIAREKELYPQWYGQKKKRRRATTRNTGRRLSHARPKPPKFSEMGVWQAVAAVRESGRPSEVASVLPPGVAAKFKKLAPGLYKYGYGPKKGEVIVRFKNAGLKGAITSTRIGAKAVGEHHWVVDNFDPKFPVVIRGIDDRGGTYWRVEEYAKQRVRVPVVVRRKQAAR